MKSFDVRVGCAGWTIPKAQPHRIPPEGSQLQRYAELFPAVDSSFYRSHAITTYSRWKASVPEHFQFAVKVPKKVTHEHRLTDPTMLEGFLSETSGLGEKLGPLLFQLPPSLILDNRTVGVFFETLRRRFNQGVVCEPRNASWFTPEADGLLAAFHVGRVAADPAISPQAAE